MIAGGTKHITPSERCPFWALRERRISRIGEHNLGEQREAGPCLLPCLSKPPAGLWAQSRSSFVGGDVDCPQRRNSVVQREQTEQTREECVVLERRNSLMSVAL